PAVALDQVQVGVHLVRPIEGRVQDAGPLQGQQRNVLLSAQVGRLLRGRHPVDVKAAGPEPFAKALDEGPGGPAGAQAYSAAVFHQFQGTFEYRHAGPPSIRTLVGTRLRTTSGPGAAAWRGPRPQ